MLTLLSTAGVEPVSLEEAKAHLALTHDADDAIVSGFISAAREQVELFTGRALVTASYAWEPPSDDVSQLPLRPGTVTSADGDRPVLFGTTAPAEIPPALRAAMLLLVADLYENREATITGVSAVENPAVKRLLWPHRINLGV